MKFYDEKEKPWNGNFSVIPEAGALVSYDTASSGLVNGVVQGYVITYRDNKPQIRVKLSDPGETKVVNERFIEELQTPLLKREKK